MNDIKAFSLYKDMVMRSLTFAKVNNYVTLYCADFSSFPTVPTYICTFMYENVYTCASIHVYSAFYNYTQLVGGADLITLGPTYTGYSSPEEITTYHTYAKSTGGSNGELHGHLSDSFSKDQEVVIEKLEWPSLEVAPTYPCKPAYSTVTIHNFRY